MQIPDVVVKKFGLKSDIGKVIGINTLRDFDTIKVKGKDAYGTAAIYDAVGNLIVNELPIEKAVNLHGTFFVYWDGTNRQNRRVGAGAYLVQFAFTYANGTQGKESKKISIRWKK
jgi:hypothetical protein